MFSLPQSTLFNKRIPKTKFYENMPVSPELKRIFVVQIKSIYWQNKIAPTTINLPAGQTVKELEVLTIQLHQPSLPETVLRQIDKGIPYHIVFLLKYEKKVQAWVSYKETAQSGKNAFIVGAYYHTEWLTQDQLSLCLDGLDLDAVYENLVRQIAGSRLAASENISLKESVEQDEKRKKLENQIAALEAKIRKEKQFNRQVELNTELKKLRKELSRRIE